jgi:hypothetical protein
MRELELSFDKVNDSMHADKHTEHRLFEAVRAVIAADSVATGVGQKVRYRWNTTL